MPDGNYTYNWTKMSKLEKYNLLTRVLTEAAHNRTFRERCLASDASALAAFAEVGDVALPRDFMITFIDEYDCGEKTNRLIVKLPPWGGENSTNEVHPDETNPPCTYSQWLRGNGKKTSRPRKRKA